MPNDSKNKVSSADALALLSATDENGGVDLFAFEAQRLIFANEKIGGIDAKGLMEGMLLLNSYNENTKDAFIDAIHSRLESNSARAFCLMLDKHAIRKIVIEAQLAEKARLHQDRLSKWASEISSHHASNKSKKRSIVNRISAYLSSGFESSQIKLIKNTCNPSLLVLSENVDLVKLAYCFNTDENYREILIGTAKICAADGLEDPSKPVRDMTKTAVVAFLEWEQGLEIANEENKTEEYLAQGNGAMGVEKMAMLLPISKTEKFIKSASDLMSDDNTAALAKIMAEASAQLSEQR